MLLNVFWTLGSLHRLVYVREVVVCRIGRLSHCHQLLWDELLCDMGYSKFQKVIVHIGTATSYSLAGMHVFCWLHFAILVSCCGHVIVSLCCMHHIAVHSNSAEIR